MANRFFNSLLAVGGGPPMPPFNPSEVAMLVGLFGLGGTGLTSGDAVVNDNWDGPAPFLSTSPYATDWTYVVDQLPFGNVVSTLYDQNDQTNNLTASSTARPNLVPTTSMFYLGQEYTWRGMINNGDGLLPYYNLLGGDTAYDHSVIIDQGDAVWSVINNNGDVVTASTNLPAFPDLATWPDDPVTAGTGSGLVAFDGIANGLQGSVNLLQGIATQTTIYLDLQLLGTPSSPAVIFETGGGTVGGGGRISIVQTADQLLASAYDSTAGHALANTKAWTIPNSNRIFICFQVDITQGDAANQTALYIDNSSADVTSTTSAPLGDVTNLGNGVPNVGARDGASSNFCEMNLMSDIQVLTVFDDSSARLVQWNYNQFLRTQ